MVCDRRGRSVVRQTVLEQDRSKRQVDVAVDSTAVAAAAAADSSKEAVDTDSLLNSSGTSSSRAYSYLLVVEQACKCRRVGQASVVAGVASVVAHQRRERPNKAAERLSAMVSVPGDANGRAHSLPDIGYGGL